MKTTLLLFAAALLCPLAAQAGAPATATPCTPAACTTSAARTQEWERRYHDQIGGRLVWNESRTMAVACTDEGADAYHTLFWCLAKQPDGSMRPVAVFSVLSNYMRAEPIHVGSEALTIRMHDAEDHSLTHEFRYEDHCGTLELWRGNILGERLRTLHNIPENIEAFQALRQQMSKHSSSVLPSNPAKCVWGKRWRLFAYRLAC